MELIKQRFLYGTNSDIPSLWASMGYIYGHCARQLYYTNKYGYNGFTKRDVEMMDAGIEMHEKVEEWFRINYPDLSIEREVKKSFGVEFNGAPFIIGAKADLIAHLHPNLQRQGMPPSLIEIKYLYGRAAYYQTLIEKLVFFTRYDPNIMVKCFQYGNLGKPQFHNQLLIPLKADIDMAIVYAGRIITSLYNMPPRFPKAYYSHPTCAKCMHRELCYTETLDTDLAQIVSDLDGWDRFKRLSQPYIDTIKRLVKNDINRIANE